MEDFLKIISNQRSIQAYTKDLGIEELEDICEKFNNVLEKRKQAFAEIEAIQAEKLAKVAEIQALLIKEGIDVNDLLDLNVKKKVKKNKKTALYQYEQDGLTRTWSGQGRKPAIIKEALEKGGKLEDFLITQEPVE